MRLDLDEWYNFLDYLVVSQGIQEPWLINSNRLYTMYTRFVKEIREPHDPPHDPFIEKCP